MNKTNKYKLKLEYTADELKELKRLNTDYHSPMNAIKQIVKEGVVGDQLGHLREKYLAMEYEDEFDFMADVNNVVIGTAIFSNPKKYYVQLIKGDCYSYLNITSDGVMELSNDFDSSTWQTKFTRDEVVAIDPKLVPFMEEVED